jgi:uncharacterized membrane protein
MNRRTVATSVLATAIGFALSTQTMPVNAADEHAGMEKCYGINAKGKNDCAGGAHSCAGQATKDRDAQSFVYVPAGACGKIAGGTTKAG